MEECETAPMRGERGGGGRSGSAAGCAVREGKADGFMRSKLLGVMKGCVCSLGINTWKENMEVCRWSGYLD